MFIYIITNTINGKVYVGQTTNEVPEYRWSSHLTEFNKNKHWNSHFQNAWNKYGDDAFVFEVIDEAKNIDELNRLEEYYIDKVYDSRNHNKGYNIRKGGRNGKHTEDTIEKIKAARAKQVFSKEAIEKRSARLRGQKRTKEQKKRMSEACKGRKLSKETKKKMSVARAGKTYEEIYDEETAVRLRELAKQNVDPSRLISYVKENGPWNKGKRGYKMSKRSEESRKRTSIALKNSKRHKQIVQSKEFREKISKTVSKLWKDPNSVYNTTEFRKKLSDARKARWEREKITREQFELACKENKKVVDRCHALDVSVPTYYKYKRMYDD